MIESVGPVLAASLLGSPHCAGMCGAFVCFYSGQDDAGPRWPGHLAYNGGRLLSYLALGALAGSLGAGVDRLGAAAGLTRTAAVAAGLLMIAWGLVTLLAARGVRVPWLQGRWIGRISQAIARRLQGKPPVVRALLLGLFTTLLPCGWLYAFVATAAGTGSVAAGMAIMAAFWLGTVPVMAGLGVAAQTAFGPLRRHLPVLTAVVVIVVGLLTVTGRLGAPMRHGRSAPAEVHQHDGH